MRNANSLTRKWFAGTIGLIIRNELRVKRSRAGAVYAEIKRCGDRERGRGYRVVGHDAGRCSGSGLPCAADCGWKTEPERYLAGPQYGGFGSPGPRRREGSCALAGSGGLRAGGGWGGGGGWAPPIFRRGPRKEGDNKRLWGAVARGAMCMRPR